MGGFHKESYDDSNVLLAGGGHKPLNEFLTDQDHYKTSPGAGTAGTSSATSGSTLSVPYVTINANGHVTGYGTHTHTISGFLTALDHYRTGPGAGMAGTNSNTSGATLAVPYITVNANGHITGYGTHTHTITGFLTAHQSFSTFDNYHNTNNSYNAHQLRITIGSTTKYCTPEWLNGYEGVDYGANGLQYMNIYGPDTGRGTASTNGTPTNDWYHIIRMNHSNNGGYFVDIAACFNSWNLWYRRIENGSLKDSTVDSGWTRILDSKNSSVSGGGSSWGSSITVKINGTEKTLTIPSNPNTNNKVYQVPTSGSDANYRVLFKYSANDTAETTYVRSCTELYYNMSTYQLTNNGVIQATQFKGTAVSNMWVNGRNNALLRETSSAGYHTIWSLKTTDGSWDCGECATSGWTNKLTLSYITDTDYNSQNNSCTYQIMFPQKSGTVALTSDIPSAVYWKDVKDKIRNGNEFNIVPSDYNDVMWFNYRSDASTNVTVTEYVFGNGSGSASASIKSGTVYPGANATYNIGTASYKWNWGYFNSGISVGTTSYSGVQANAEGTTIGKGTIEMNATDPFIDFHKSGLYTSDYSSRLVHWSSRDRLSYECKDSTYSGYVATCEGNLNNLVIIGVFDLYRETANTTTWKLSTICGPCSFTLQKDNCVTDIEYTNSSEVHSWTISNNIIRVYVNSPSSSVYALKSTPHAVSCDARVMTRWLDNAPVVTNIHHGHDTGCSIECLCTNLAAGNSLYYNSQSPGRYIYITGSRPWGYDNAANGMGMDMLRLTGNTTYQRIRFTVFGYLS